MSILPDGVNRIDNPDAREQQPTLPQFHKKRSLIVEALTRWGSVDIIASVTSHKLSSVESVVAVTLKCTNPQDADDTRTYQTRNPLNGSIEHADSMVDSFDHDIAAQFVARGLAFLGLDPIDDADSI